MSLRAVFLALAVAALSSQALAANIVAESDTGIVFGDLDCPIQSHDVTSIAVFEGDWGYLYARMGVKYTCVTDDGLQWQHAGQDDMFFPTLRFDSLEQGWVIGDVVVAWRTNDPLGRVRMNPDLYVAPWSYGDETHVALKAQIKKKATE